jgi:hypothetical protein
MSIESRFIDTLRRHVDAVDMFSSLFRTPPWKAGRNNP